MNSQLQTSGFIPKSFDEAIKIAGLICNSTLVPVEYRGQSKQGDALAAIMYGAELNLAPLQALQSIAVINGKPSVYGDALIALVQGHPMYDGISEEILETKSGLVAVCTIKRKGSEPHTVKFSQEDAVKAGLWGRKGPWQTYPKRMLQMRARGFACRDQFADALKGIITAEEAQDYPSKDIIDITPTKEVKPHEIEIKTESGDDQLVIEYKNMIQGCESSDSLKALGTDIASFSSDTKEKLRPVYEERLQHLSK